MGNERHNPKRQDWSDRPHERFLELCALSTAGGLTEEEQQQLQTHLGECVNCRLALKEFEAVADISVPLFGAYAASRDFSASTAIPALAATVPESDARDHTGAAIHVQGPLLATSGLRLFGRQSHGRTWMNWNYVWMPFAAAVALTAALGVFSYRIGKQTGQQVAQFPPPTPDSRLSVLERQIGDLSNERQTLKTQLVQRDGNIEALRRQLNDESRLLAEAKSAQAELERSVQTDQKEKQRLAEEHAVAEEKFNFLQTSLQKTETELATLQERRTQEQSRSESLEAQIRDLHGQLRDREQELGKQEDLLAHDRDIRELMGARDLYIAEVYDVARDGQTQKPYGRVFYTKGKSLIFYAYDLDQESGYKSANAFQAWGSRGLDRQQAMSLGVFYEDSLAKKRWVVKFNDPKKLEQIDSVFVTVEPHGGSHKPSGKPLLFAYLKVDPNHP